MAAIGTWVIRTLELLFAVGIVGSAVVILLTSVEDTKEVVNREKGDGAAERLDDSAKLDLSD